MMAAAPPPDMMIRSAEKEEKEKEETEKERERGRQAVTRPKPFPQKQNNRQNIVATVAAADGGKKDGRWDGGDEQAGRGTKERP